MSEFTEIGRDIDIDFTSFDSVIWVNQFDTPLKMDHRKQLLDILRNFHDIENLRIWATRNNLEHNQDVQERIKDILYFQQQTNPTTESEAMWNLVVNSFTLDELLKFAYTNHCFYDGAVQKRLQELTEVHVICIIL